MLSREENELLTRVGTGTPMGELIRRYWIPALLSEEIPELDCPPVRVRLMGEDLVAFRDSKGRVGLLEEHCSHRGASLFYGRNEECGLRCVYHGWKYDVEGNVLETPAEPSESNLKYKVHHKAYPCQEASGIVFSYLGPKEKMPLFPNYEWLTVPLDHVGVTKFFIECNYLQALEGDCDSSHGPFLHRGSHGGGLTPSRGLIVDRCETREAWFGIKSAAIRDMESGLKHARVYSFVMPFIACVPAGGKNLVVYQTPSDDYHTWRYNIRFKREEPISAEDIKSDRCQTGPDYKLIASKYNNYLIDREKQRTTNYTGLEGFAVQDACVTESMGPICDRTKEHLGAGDAYVIAVRRFLLRATKALQNRLDSPGLDIDPENNDFSEITFYDRMLPLSDPWK